jgi:dienelactone hydrolase
LLQGASDPRVPKEEAQQAYDSLKAAGRTVELHIYAQEGHGFLKRENRTDALTRIVQWFETHAAWFKRNTRKLFQPRESVVERCDVAAPVTLPTISW